MVLEQVDSHQGNERVERLPPAERSDDALSARFATFAAEECSGQSGLNVFSPTYEALSLAVAANAALLAMARECRVGQPIPNLFFAAVKRTLADHPGDGLARRYASAAAGETPADGVSKAFADFCVEHEAEIVRLVRIRRVQTNEIRRCAYLMPAFGVIANENPGARLALIDVGASAGLNLIWDRYRYRYSDGSAYGPRDSGVLVESETRTAMPSIPNEFPAVGFRAGIDLSPIDLRIDEEFRWMQALVWPDHPDRAALLDAARLIWLEDPPEVVAGDAAEVIPRLLRRAPRDAALCVFHCHTLNQFPPDARAAFYDILRRESAGRTVYHLPSEGERMSLDRIENGRATTILSARRNAHGRWIEWEC